MPRRDAIVILGGQLGQKPDSDFLNLGKLNVGSPMQVVAASTVSVSNSFVGFNNTGNGIQNIDTISGGDQGDILIIGMWPGSNSFRIRKGNGNVLGGPNRLFTDSTDIIVLLAVTDNLWFELAWQG